MYRSGIGGLSDLREGGGGGVGGNKSCRSLPWSCRPLPRSLMSRDCQKRTDGPAFTTRSDFSLFGLLTHSFSRVDSELARSSGLVKTLPKESVHSLPPSLPPSDWPFAFGLWRARHSLPRLQLACVHKERTDGRRAANEGPLLPTKPSSTSSSFACSSHCTRVISSALSFSLSLCLTN